jgi:hypothetical protein
MSRLFRNRAVQTTTRLVKTEGGEETVEVQRDPFEGVALAEAYAEVAKDFITHTALVIGGVFAACQIVKRICK